MVSCGVQQQPEKLHWKNDSCPDRLPTWCQLSMIWHQIAMSNQISKKLSFTIELNSTFHLRFMHIDTSVLFRHRHGVSGQQLSKIQTWRHTYTCILLWTNIYLTRRGNWSVQAGLAGLNLAISWLIAFLKTKSLDIYLKYNDI